MPRPVNSRSTYLPGLDGIRALAVIAVFGYHLAIPGMAGGLLGVGVFFTLSGFLITRILLSSWERTGTLQLGRFWLHRARRLLPAVLVMLLVVLLATWLVAPDQMGVRWGQSWSAAVYVANWHTIAADQSYFERFAGPGPLDHLWSLSVEEQFYLIWPLVLLICLRLLKLRRRWVIALTATAAIASFVALALVASPGFDNTRAYEGTDTRAGGILIGALLALGWDWIVAIRRRRWLVQIGLHLAAIGGIAAIVWLISTTDDYSISLYSYGLLLLSLSTAAVVAATAMPRSAANVVLGVQPLRWIGERSYGLYLWQLPVIAALSPDTVAGNRFWWSVMLVAVTVALAELSWRFVENPIRTRGFTEVYRDAKTRIRAVGHGSWHAVWRPGLISGAAALVLLGVGSLVVVAKIDPNKTDSDDMAMLAGFPPDPPAMPAAPGAPDATQPEDGGEQNWDGSDPYVVVRPGPPIQLKGHKSNGTGPGPGSSVPRPETSCTSVMYVGESTSLGLISSSYLPDPGDRIGAQLQDVGVRQVRTDILGARSIVEKWHDQPNAQEAVDAGLAAGFDDCWIIAMGTNDSANVAVGGSYTYPERIDLLMNKLKNERVMWLTVKSLRTSGPYDNANMAAFDDQLRAACDRYPNLRLFDWAAEAQNSWFISDGIHYTSDGYRERGHRIANALAHAFPADSAPSPTCSVTSY